METHKELPIHLSYHPSVLSHAKDIGTLTEQERLKLAEDKQADFRASHELPELGHHAENASPTSRPVVLAA